MESEEVLKAENERLVAEMSSLKKKIMLALKKQQAELQAKIQAAEQRAMAAEAAAMASSSFSPAACRSSTETRSDLEVDSASTSPEGYSNGDAPEFNEISRLQSELENERLRRIKLQEDSGEEIRRLQEELCQFKQETEKEQNSVGELEERQKRIEELSKVNERMEAQLLSAAQQVSDAFSRIAEMHEKLEGLSKERDAVNQAYEKLSEENDRMRKDLENANEDAYGKAKEMEEMMTCHRATQEGQEAAMSQLMQQMQAIQASTTPKAKELDMESESTEEKHSLAEKIEEHNRQVELLQRELTELQKSEASLKQQNGTITDEVSKLRDLNSMLEGRLQDFAKPGHESEQSQTSALLEEIARLKEKLTAAEEKTKALSGNHEVSRQFEGQLKERDDKYAELDNKFNRLQKRAKQRIQEIQKEKEEIEAQLHSAQEKEALAVSKQASVQSELERFRAQAGDAIRALDAERQNLRNTNLKLKEEADELRRALAAKEHNLEESRRLASEKDQTALSMHAEMKEAEEKHAATLSELEEKHKKELEGLQSQLAEIGMEKTKLAEAISNLQAVLVEKESKLTAVEAALTGEVARLSVAIESEKREVAQIREEKENERRRWQDILTESESKFHQLENAYRQLELTFSESKRQWEGEVEGQRQALADAQRETDLAKDEVARWSKEFAAYKVRAHALLQKKDAELHAARDADLAAAQEAILKDAQKQATAALAERDRAVSSLNQAINEYETQLAARNVAIVDAEQRIKDLATKLESVKGVLTYEREEAKRHLHELQSSWQEKYDELARRQRHPAEESFKSELSALQLAFEQMKSEYDGFRDMANKMVEAKDKEISKLLDDNNNLQKELQIQDKKDDNKRDVDQQDSSVPIIAIAEQQILLLARQQAQREEELKQCQRQIQVLQEELSELEHENRLHSQQEAVLKNELRNMERAAKRETVDMTYLKNVVLKLLETGEVEVLLPVLGTLLQFSPEEIKRCQEVYTASGVESPASTPRALLSRLSFSGSR